MHLSFSKIALLLLCTVMIVCSCNNTPATTTTITDSAVTTRKTTTTTVVTNTTPPSIITELPVTVLHSIDGGAENDSSISADHYPAKDTLEPDSLNSIVGAYGIAYEVWIGPKGWTGDGIEGGDGNVVAKLYPPNLAGTSDSTPHVSYYEVPACVGCMLSAGAVYFPGAMKEYNEEYGKVYKDHITIPAGLKIKRISPTLVTYTMPVKHHLLWHGVAYYRPDGDYYAEATIVLPENDSLLADFVAKTFIHTRHLE